MGDKKDHKKVKAPKPYFKDVWPEGDEPATPAPAPAPAPDRKPATKMGRMALKKEGMMANIVKGHYSLRLHNVAGDFTSDQLHAIADTATKYAKGKVHLTSRQSIEIPCMDVTALDAARDDLEANDCTTGLCGPRVRTVPACLGMTVCPWGNIDTKAIAAEIDRRYMGRVLAGKFKFAVTGCHNDCQLVEARDMGITGGVRVTWLEDPCIQCKICVRNCKHDALKLEGDKIVVNYDNCQSCGVCVHSCPQDSWGFERIYTMTFGGLFKTGNVRVGREVLPPATSRKQLFRVIDATIDWYDQHADSKRMERFADTLERVGWDDFTEYVRAAYDAED